LLGADVSKYGKHTDMEKKIKLTNSFLLTEKNKFKKDSDEKVETTEPDSATTTTEPTPDNGNPTEKSETPMEVA
jgi:hypothetical protein